LVMPRSSTAGLVPVGFKPRMNTNRHELDRQKETKAWEAFEKLGMTND
jgi:hypothetical protein